MCVSKFRMLNIADNLEYISVFFMCVLAQHAFGIAKVYLLQASNNFNPFA